MGCMDIGIDIGIGIGIGIVGRGPYEGAKLAIMMLLAELRFAAQIDGPSVLPE